jgi:hypothetical protein
VWGDAIHDRVFAPAGVIVSGTGRSVPATSVQLYLGVPVDDPGGWCDIPGNRLVVPADAEGLYIVAVRLNAVGGTAGDFIRCYLRVNGAEVSRAFETSEGGANIIMFMTTVIGLTAGDVVTVHAIKLSGGANPTVSVSNLSLIRHGAAIGAP